MSLKPVNKLQYDCGEIVWIRKFSTGKSETVLKDIIIYLGIFGYLLFYKLLASA